MENYFEELTDCEILAIDGGSFWNDVAYGVGYASGRVCWAFRSMMALPYDRPTLWIHK